MHGERSRPRRRSPDAKRDHNIADIYPLTPMQQGMLFHTLYNPRAGLYLDEILCHLHTAAELDVGAFRKACAQVLERHSALRSAFVWQRRDRPLQLVLRHVELEIGYLDWRRLDAVRQDRELRAISRADRERGFDLSQPPLLRLTLARLSGDDYKLFLRYHHMLMDAWSVAIVLREMLSFYEGNLAGTPASLPRPRPFGDYIRWLRQQNGERTEAFWRRQLRGFDAPTPLTASLGNVAAAKGGSEPSFAERELRLPAVATERLKELAKTLRCTLSTVVQGAWALLLGRYSDRSEVVFGTVVSGRPEVLSGVGSMVGSFINTLPLRVRLEPSARAGRWLQGLQAQLSQMRQFEHSSLAEIQEWSELPRGQQPFESLFVFENTPLVSAELRSAGALEIRETRYRARTNYPVTIAVTPGRELVLQISFDGRRLDAPTAELVLRHFRRQLVELAASAARQLAELRSLSPVERQQIAEWSDTARRFDPVSGAHHLFAAQVARTPDSVAVEHGDQVLTYGELQRRVEGLARRLGDAGVGPEVPVGLCAERGLEMVIGLLAVFRAGGAYVALDPRTPRRRLDFILRDAGVRRVLASPRRAALVRREGVRVLTWGGPDPPASGEPPADSSVPAQLAYLAYTSGSTGTPKAVMISQGALSNYLRAAKGHYRLGSRDAVLLFSALDFDGSAEEILAPLVCGARVAVCRDPMLTAPGELLRTCGDRRLTVLILPTAYWQQVVNGLSQDGLRLPRSLRLLCVGGETVPAEWVDEWRRSATGVPLFNIYGPTETTIVATVGEIPVAGGGVPIGRPVANLRTYVLDRRQHHRPGTLAGELCLAGVGLARGYLGRPAATAERFLPDPFSEQPGERMFRTGDLVRRRTDGTLEVLGRLDHQVKVRGYRIEPGEIEAALLRQPEVREAVVTAPRAASESRCLVAYFVKAGAVAPSPAQLRQRLRAVLPGYMVPAAFVELQALPLTGSGKLDRRALPPPEVAATAHRVGGEEPRTPVEELLADVWCQVLGVDRVGNRDSFIELGGHSLLATQVVSRVRRALAVELPLRLLFEASTLAELAEKVEDVLREQSGLTSESIHRVRRDQPLAVSFAQQQLWFLHALDPADASYNVPLVLSLTGQLDLAALERACDEIVRRHEALRTVFAVGPEGLPVQVVQPAAAFRLPLVDLSRLARERRLEEAEHQTAEEARRLFDLAVDLPLRVQLLRLAEDRYRLLITLHHIVSDGWSTEILLQELATLYQTPPAALHTTLPELSIQYADFAAWQRQTLQGQELEKLLGFWRRQLSDLPVLDLPLDRRRGSAAIQSRGATERLVLSRQLSDELRALCRRCGVTLFVLLVAAFKALLHARSGQTDIVIGSDFAGRNRAELEQLIGFFVNQVVLRTDLSRDPTFKELLARVKEVTMMAYAHQDLPFDRLVEALNPDRDLALTPLFQVKLVLQNTPRLAPVVKVLGVESVAVGDHPAKFDLLFNLQETADGLRGTLEYRRELFDAATVVRLLEQYKTFLERVAVDPGVRLSELTWLASKAEKEWRGVEKRHLNEARRRKIHTVRRRVVHG